MSVDVSPEAVITAYIEEGVRVSPGDFLQDYPDKGYCGCALGVLAAKKVGKNSVRGRLAVARTLSSPTGTTDRILADILELEPDYAIGYGHGFWHGYVDEHYHAHGKDYGVKDGDKYREGCMAGVAVQEAVKAALKARVPGLKPLLDDDRDWEC